MKELVCSVCGCVSNQKKFRHSSINKHFNNAEEIWCPTKKCRENNKEKRVIPDGYICNCWMDYGGWYTIEKKPKITNINTAESIQKAKSLKEIGLQILQEQGKLPPSIVLDDSELHNGKKPLK